MDKTIEQQARELLAEEAACSVEYLPQAYISPHAAIRAITRALTQAKPGWRVVPVVPTPEMLEASYADAPYVCRLKIDKSAYEVVRLDGPDWPEVITDEQTVVFVGSDDEAWLECRRLAATHRYAAMLAAAPEPQQGEGA